WSGKFWPQPARFTNGGVRGFKLLCGISMKKIERQKGPDIMNESTGAATAPAIIPASWGPHGRGADISYTIVDSPFGRMLVAVTARGICALSVYESDEWQESELRRDFSEAKITRETEIAGNDGAA